MRKKVILAAIIIIAAICMFAILQNPVVLENKTEENPVFLVNESSFDEKYGVENISESAVAKGIESVTLNDYSDALGIGESFWYDEKTDSRYPAGGNKNGISISIEETRMSSGLYLKDLSSGFESLIKPPQDFKYILVKVSAAPLGEYLLRHTSPVTNSFELLDSLKVYSPLLIISDETGVILKNETSWDTKVNENFVISNVGRIYVAKTIYSSLNKAGGSGPVSGWIIFEVPDSFVISPDTYVKFSPEKTVVLWRLHDIRAYTDIYISPESGNIKIVYKGGPDQYLVTKLKATLKKTDGSVVLKSVEKDEDEESLSPWAEIMIFGSGPVAGDELLTVKLIRYDGEQFTKYEKIV